MKNFQLIFFNGGKRLAVDALVQFFSTDLPSHNAVSWYLYLLSITCIWCKEAKMHFIQKFHSCRFMSILTRTKHFGYFRMLSNR